MVQEPIRQPTKSILELSDIQTRILVYILEIEVFILKLIIVVRCLLDISSQRNSVFQQVLLFKAMMSQWADIIKKEKYNTFVAK